jgi:hypothetical protein
MRCELTICADTGRGRGVGGCVGWFGRGERMSSKVRALSRERESESESESKGKADRDEKGERPKIEVEGIN